MGFYDLVPWKMGHWGASSGAHFLKEDIVDKETNLFY